MDRFVAHFPAVPDGDLRLCFRNGVAYQRDMTQLVEYGEDYFNKCLSYEDQEIAEKINAGRINFVAAWYGFDGLDIGIGSGEYLKKGGAARGYDVNPVAAKWLKENSLWSDQFDQFGAFTFWDVLEHIPEPEDYFRHMRSGSYLFCSLPIFTELTRIRESRHYRPGEHLYYWTEKGFTDWMASHGFELLDRRDFEIQAGRDSILSFAFQKNQ